MWKEMRLEVFRGGGKWPFYLRLVNWSNGETLLTSEGYSRRWNARRAAKKVAAAFGIEWVDLT